MKFAAQTDYESIEAVEAEYPGAAHIQEVAGGWMVFDTIAEFDNWQAQV